jgi:LmbE family N-acetylglucosaminyl deacetylase
LDACFRELNSLSCKGLQYFCEALHIRYNQRMFRLLAVTAHPDDEAGNYGGLLPMYRDRGVETCVICLTQGQAASHRGGVRTDQELADLRQQEFSESCRILKVSRPLILNYPDGQLYRQELNRVVYDLSLHVRQFCPDVMLTFGAEGGVTGHPDHSMAGIFATLAFHWAARANRYADQLHDGLAPHRTQKLYHATAEFPLPNRPPITFSPLTTVIDISNYLETKVAAFKAHQTQAPLWPLFEDNLRKRAPQEMLHLAASVKAGPLKPDTDIFDGVEATER